MAIGRTIYSERNNNAGERIVEIGKWSGVPTGPWCSWSPSENDGLYSKGYARDGKNTSWRTTPRGGDGALVWWTVAVEAGRTWLSARKWMRGKSYARTTFASPEDLWSCAYQNAEDMYREKGYRFGKTWHAVGPALGVIDEPNTYEGFGLYRALLKRPIDELHEIRAILVAAGADPRPLELVDFAVETAKARMVERAAQAAATRAQTKAKADKGGNPKTIKAGDRVVLRYPFHTSGNDERFFWYTPYSGAPNGKCYFFLTVDAKGLGTGYRYSPRKYDALRACIAAFEILNAEHPKTPISLHQQMALLADQAGVERRRAAAKAPQQDTTPCTCDS